MKLNPFFRHDAVYELYVQIKGAASVPFLDYLYSLDQFEERPLIWKAHLYLETGELEQAKDLALRSITIDPSDGEQGPGDRMRAYEILAEIVQNTDPQAAEIYRNAVRSIRLSESADRYTDVGMHTAAISMYQSAAEVFSNAYCIQSRLAIQLTKQGRFDEAVEHYRTAYRLTPDSFGRVESHCFGCETVFDDPRAQTLAESTFEELVKGSPSKPQIHYMLGFLKKQQGKYAEAAESFRRAVGIDGEYLNAWKQLYKIGGRTHMETWERDLAALKLLELDPLQRHTSTELSAISDLKGLWRQADKAIALLPKPVDFLYPLFASVDHIEVAESELSAQQQSMLELSLQAYVGSPGLPANAALTLLSTDLVRLTTLLLAPNSDGYY